MSKRDRDLIRELEALGYAYDRTNSKNFDFYIHENTGHEVKVLPGSNESVARSVLRTARQQIGIATKDNKRNPAAIRERNAAEHAKAAAELKRLADRRQSASPELLREIEAAYLAAEKKFRYWDRLMRESVGVS